MPGGETGGFQDSQHFSSESTVKSGESELTSLPSSVLHPELKSSTMDDTLSSISTAGSLTEISDDVTKSGKGLQVKSAKSLLIGSNAFALSCRVVEQFLLLNYFDQADRDAENVSPSRYVRAPHG